MPLQPLNRLVDHLRRTAVSVGGEPMTDGELLERFVAERDPLAFELLLRRHAPMVLGVCRRVIGNVHDAEDAFQATFLVLVRKAARVRPREAVGTWLYGVAYRTALGARSRLARRRMHETVMANVPACAAEPDALWHDLRPVLDRELNALPDKYRLPVVLCDLEGRPRKEVARALRIPEGTLSSRLATARRMLASRLTRRGVTLSAGALAAVLLPSSASACVPGTLLFSTTQAALVFAAGPAVAAGAVPGPVAALTEGVMRMMFLAKLKMTAVVVAGVAAVSLGTGGLIYQAQAGMGDGAGGQDVPQQRTLRDKERTPAGQQRHDRDANTHNSVAELQVRLQKAQREAEVARQEAIAQRIQAEVDRRRAEALLQHADAQLKLAQAQEARLRQQLQKGLYHDQIDKAKQAFDKGLSRHNREQADRQKLEAARADRHAALNAKRDSLKQQLADLERRFAQQRQQLEEQMRQLQAEVSGQQPLFGDAFKEETRPRHRQPGESVDRAKAPVDHQQPGESIDRAKAPVDQQQAACVFSCRYIRASEAARILQKLLVAGKKVYIAVDDRANAVHVTGAADEMASITKLMQKIDRPQAEGAQAPVSSDKLDRILERLDRLERRIDRIENRQAGPAS